VLSIRAAGGCLHGGKRRRARHHDRGLSGAGDARYPKNDDQVVFGDNASPPKTWPFHVLLSVPLQPKQIETIGAREGWRAKTFGRGMRGHKPFFHVIEFWLENRLMIEVVSPEMAREYEDFLKNARTEIMGDPEAVRLMRATHVKEPA
jgi:hypothetical protein